MKMPLNSDIIFALDIGTRTVKGIVCERQENGLKIIAESMCEHSSRSMIDGQVHDIDKVSQVVIKVKKELEEKIGFTLKNAAIAAAGRTLKTKCVHVEKDMEADIDIDDMIINSLELSGVNEATKLIRKESKYMEDDFYCVGYSVVSYYLNGYPITSLMEHKGRYIGADILATFLPGSVVESLYKVLEKSSLNPICLTLEPIAALEAIVPENIRLLNIALIDIGAGTSDIAITKNGSITAYGMVSVAGDEVTEALADRYLLDFNSAESVKRSVSKRRKKISFKDITGAKVSVKVEEVASAICGSSKKIAHEIADAVLSLNGTSPRAVFCVGGGSRTSGLIDELSSELGMDRERIAVKKRTSIPNLESVGHLVDGPEGVTVVGIALVAFKKVGHDFINLFLNGKECRLFNSADLSVKDVLGLVGFSPSSLIGKSGKALKFTFEGVPVRVPGTPSQPPEIYVNGVLGSLQTRVYAGDSINIKDAKDGKDACASVSDIALRHGIDIYGKVIKANGKIVDGSHIICEGDFIESCASDDKKSDGKSMDVESINVSVNGKNIKLSGKNHIFVDVLGKYNIDLSKFKNRTVRITVNGKEAGYSDAINDGDKIEITAV
ncbi:MAG TPA: molecular chaperone Hsp70 [Clostridiaceae bacterium]|nr:molecular chaperone Hsp70 [Clostridiaceae bacterium]